MKRICLLGLVFLLSVALAHAQDREWATLNAEVVKLYREGKYDQAVIVAKKALAVAEATVGPAHPNVATSLNNLALLYATQGRYAQAEPLYTRALAIWEKVLGPNHPDVATVLENMVVLYGKTGDTAKQQACEARAKWIRAQAR